MVQSFIINVIASYSPAAVSSRFPGKSSGTEAGSRLLCWQKRTGENCNQRKAGTGLTHEQSLCPGSVMASGINTYTEEGKRVVRSRGRDTRLFDTRCENTTALSKV